MMLGQPITKIHQDEVYPELHITSMQQFTCVAVAVCYIFH